ncbi:uncharacterized protein LOC122249697 [Penaeus japonicus]|uniref:uncharacterized protein LOC122249697 n=1 Tax=Penaeus japonicus TaxID=27405 RepID=UPI001C70CD98|nr:uncharacterized protein LOC122249697 [Penaeus japonicus]
MDIDEPDYLVNQSSHTCLTVVRGSSPHDAVIAMAKCSGNVKQQWFFHRGQWQWGGDRQLCLDVDQNNVVLRECTKSSTVWAHDPQGRIVTGSRGLDVPWGKPRTAVILYPKHDGANQKWWTLSGLKASLGGSAGVRMDCLPARVLEICQKECQAEHAFAPDQVCQCCGKAKDGGVPEYLISQSTNTCLTVLSGSEPGDAVIGLAEYTGSARQQWFVQGGQWQWAGNRSLCLSPDNRHQGLCLANARANTAFWTIDEAGIFGTESRALDVPWEEPRTKVILYPAHGGQNQRRRTALETALRIHEAEARKRRPSQDGVDGNEGKQCACQAKTVSQTTSQSTSDVPEDPDYLISQSTNTCLTVLSGSEPGDAVIGLAEYTGSARQQWFVQGGQWQWAGNRSLCLSPDNRHQGLCLANARANTAFWTIDEAGIFGTESRALDVPWEEPRTKVILYPAHGGQNQRWWTVSLISMLLEMPQTKDKLSETALRIHEAEARKRRPSQDGVDGNEGKQCACQAKTVSQTTSQSTSDVPEDPDYLISQSTHTCLTVLSGSEPGDAVIGLAEYTGSARQQWFVQGGQWQWAGNRSLCLSPDNRHQGLCLANARANTAFWTIDEAGIFGTESRALDVPWEEPRTRVLLYPAHGGQNQKWWRLSSLIAATRCVRYPLACTDVDTYKQEMARILVNKLSNVSKPLPHALDVDAFPGTVAKTTPRCSRSYTLDLTVLGQASNLRMTAPEDWQPTDAYVPAGDVFRIVLPESLSEARAAQITARVGAQRDTLDPESGNVVDQRKFLRCPVVSEEFELKPGVNTLRSQFGGSLIFTYEEGENFTTSVEVHNVVEAPFYVMGQTTTSEWAKMKQLDAPYCVLVADKVVVVAPTKAARKLSDPKRLLRRYDDIIGMLESLSGFTAEDPPPRGKQWLVDDVQISCGSAHAGFPAMFDRQYYDLTSLGTPHDWVSWHELGHNYQQDKWWSYTYGSESTVNLFSCYIEEQIGNGNRLLRENRYTEAAFAVDKGLTFEAADCWHKLVFLMEIKNAFPNPGWDMFRNLNRSVRALSPDQADHLAASEQRKLDYVYKILSREVGADLILHYRRWGISISHEAEREIQQEGLRKAPADLTGRK